MGQEVDVDRRLLEALERLFEKHLLFDDDAWGGLGFRFRRELGASSRRAAQSRQ